MKLVSQFQSRIAVCCIALLATVAQARDDPPGEDPPQPLWHCGGPWLNLPIPDEIQVLMNDPSDSLDALLEIVRRAKASINCPDCGDPTQCQPDVNITNFDAYIEVPGGAGQTLYIFYGAQARVRCLPC